MARQAAYFVLNAGSSSLKFLVFRQHQQIDDLQAILCGQISGIAVLGCRVPVLVIPTNEEMMIAKHTINVLSQNRRNV